MFAINSISKHASDERLHQRGVSEQLLDLASRFGDKSYGHKQACWLYFSERSIKKMIEAGVPMKLVQMAEGKRNLRFVVSTGEGCLITAKYAYGHGRLRVNQ
jgi:hypothetical protein